MLASAPQSFSELAIAVFGIVADQLFGGRIEGLHLISR
jgi:hypothetical protein